MSRHSRQVPRSLAASFPLSEKTPTRGRTASSPNRPSLYRDGASHLRRRCHRRRTRDRYRSPTHPPRPSRRGLPCAAGATLGRSAAGPAPETGAPATNGWLTCSRMRTKTKTSSRVTCVARARISSPSGNTSKMRRTDPYAAIDVFVLRACPHFFCCSCIPYTFPPPLFFLLLCILLRVSQFSFLSCTFLFIATRTDDMRIPSCVCIVALRQIH